jgi:magnesium-transporting ATPase (P-type)
LQAYTANGYRVIALAGKQLDDSISWNHSLKLTRDEIESELDFYGFLIMQNMIKPETTPIISELTEAGITSVMVTGDNLLTALSVARKCGMIHKDNKVVLVEAHSPHESHISDETNFVPARIEWKLVEHEIDMDEMENNPNQTSYQVNTNVFLLFFQFRLFLLLGFILTSYLL